MNLSKAHDRLSIQLTCIFIFFLTFNNACGAETVNHSIFNQLLQQYVSNGNVRYQGFKADEARLDSYLGQLEKVQPSTLSRSDQFAFYINAYNAWTIKLILSVYPKVESIKDLGSFFKSPWKKKFVKIDGQTMTLDNIEHDILRPRFKDPRIHFAVNCASKGCPPLLNEAYLGSRIDEQLEKVTRAFINNPARNHLEGHTLYVNKIFKWYSEDFNENIPEFFLKYSEGDLKKRLNANKRNLTIKYLDYDWSLNGD